MTSISRPTAQQDGAAFRRAIRQQPHQIGAIAQTGHRLAAHAAALIPDTATPHVVELGPGAGAITDVLHQSLPPDGRLTAVELNTPMVAHLRQTRPWLTVLHGDAAKLPDLLRDNDLPAPDLIVSALPWTLWTVQQQRDTLDALHAALAPGGAFTTIVTISAAPWPTARRFRRLLAEKFTTVRASPLVWRNMPPAYWHIAS